MTERIAHSALPGVPTLREGPKPSFSFVRPTPHSRVSPTQRTALANDTRGLIEVGGLAVFSDAVLGYMQLMAVESDCCMQSMMGGSNGSIAV